MPDSLDTRAWWSRALAALGVSLGALWIFGTVIFYILRMVFRVYLSEI